tara:strand:+ start:195 stop:410 length:216 start_codon:yes stop_codon:yes gene_type:complete
MTNVIKVNFPVNLPLEAITKEANKVVRELFWGLDDYDMFLGYMEQFMDSAEALTYKAWADIVNSHNVVLIK